MKHPASINKLPEKGENIFRSINQHPQIARLIDSLANPFAAGTFYYFHHRTSQSGFHFVSDSLKTVLGYEKEEFTPEFLFDILHPEDQEKIREKESMALWFFGQQTSVEITTSYKAAFLIRLRHANGNYRTILHQARPISVSEQGEVLETISVHTDISFLNPSVDHKLSFLSKNKPSFLANDTEKKSLLSTNCCFKQLTSREIDIITCAGLGMNIDETADKLFLSPHTVKTHKKKILRKSGCSNFTELVARCLKEGII
ncbi:PAS domain-containing protein [Maribellus sediminis]|uniref:PAS domain-containing protein n=1 Tax=Maribellus sediminis TaxID=2696285 RepID=UPI00142FF4A9|nr:PAS domain-containing protein [Maribellus sediminis]